MTSRNVAINFCKLIVDLGADRDDDDMQFNINRIVKWCETWSIELSLEKYKIMHLDYHPSPENYFIAGKKIGVTECERDLGVLISSDGT